MVADLNVMPESSDDSRSSSDKGNQARVPKKIHKAEREKLKRDHLNELFIKLGHALEPSRQNNGKASILADATKLLRELVMQVESLRRENVSLLNESRYVTQEKNDLKDETTVLVAEIEKLHSEIRERTASNPAWGNGSDAIPSIPRPSTALQAQQPPVVGPMYVMPVHRDIQPYPEVGTEPSPVPKPSSQVRRPHARYPTPTDSWPHQILSQQTRAADPSGGRSSSSSNSNTTASSNSKNEEGTIELKLLD